MSNSDYQFALYGYWRSSASWRVRLVCAIKEIPFEYRPVNLLTGEHKNEDFHGVNFAGLVPVLVVHDNNGKEITKLTQSVAIIDFLDHYRPEHPLMPTDFFLRARVLEIVNTVVCDTHPLQNPRVIATYPEEKRNLRIKEVITAGLRTVEDLITKHNPDFDGKHCVGNTVTLADVILIPQVYNALRFEIDMSLIPKVHGIYQYLNTLEPFVKAFPDNQDDCPNKK